MAEVLQEEDYDYCIESHDLQSLLSVRGRDFLVRNNGDDVNVSNLQGKLVALYFSGLSSLACRRFNPKLCNAYDELLSRHHGAFEVVFVSAYDNEDSFWKNFANMPWLAIPFCDTVMRNRLNDLFSVQQIPHLVIFDESGKRCSEDGVQMISKYGSEAYPFTIEKFNENREAARLLHSQLLNFMQWR